MFGINTGSAQNTKHLFWKFLKVHLEVARKCDIAFCQRFSKSIYEMYFHQFYSLDKNCQKNYYKNWDIVLIDLQKNLTNHNRKNFILTFKDSTFDFLLHETRNVIIKCNRNITRSFDIGNYITNAIDMHI